MTMVPRTGPFSASSALATTSWYQRGKSVAWGVRTGALAMIPNLEAGRGPGRGGGREHGVGSGQRPLGELGDPPGGGERREGHSAEVGGAEVRRRERQIRWVGRRGALGAVGA